MKKYVLFAWAARTAPEKGGRNLDAKKELEKMRVEASQEQEKELKSNFQRLSLERRAQVVMLSRKLVEEEAVTL